MQQNNFSHNYQVVEVKHLRYFCMHVKYLAPNIFLRSNIMIHLVLD